MSAVGSRYRAASTEDVTLRTREQCTVPQSPVNLVIYPNLYSHIPYTRQYITHEFAAVTARSVDFFFLLHISENVDSIMGASHMSDNRQMSVAMQRLVDFISMVTNSMLLCNNRCGRLPHNVTVELSEKKQMPAAQDMHKYVTWNVLCIFVNLFCAILVTDWL
jgi:hypothetical protein